MLPVTRSRNPGIQRATPGFSLADIAIEVRYMIYNAINEPRLVEIRYSESLNCVWSPTKVPMGLRLCKESREEAKRHYQYGFRGRDTRPRTWFDFRCDAMYFSNYCLTVNIESLAYLIVHFDDDEAEGVKHLAMDYKIMVALSAQLAADVGRIEEEDGNPWDAQLILIPEFHHLEKLTINMNNNGGFKGRIFDSHDFEMLVEMCERARDEELGNWNMPVMGRVSERKLSTWLPIRKCIGVSDVSVLMTGDRVEDPHTDGAADVEDVTDESDANDIEAAIAIVSNGA